MRARSVLVIDDEPAMAERMAAKVATAGKNSSRTIVTTPLAGDELKKEIKILLTRRESLKKKPKKAVHRGDSRLDEGDILVIDYDLSSLYGEDGLMTGELLASLSRRYSFVGLIVSVNRYGPRKFDLSLRGAMGSRADLSVSHEDLGDSGLWTTHWNTYRPWHWPMLIDYADTFSERVSACENAMGKPVVELLSMPKSVQSALPQQTADILGRQMTATPLDISRESAVIGKYRDLPVQLAARVAASEIGRWVETSLLPTQDVLIDAPHVGSLFPSLVKGDASKLGTLNGLADLNRSARLPIEEARLTRYKFGSTFPSSRSAWWTDLVLSSGKLTEVREPLSRGNSPYVFAEDTSRFHTRKSCKSFVSTGLFTTKWVRQPDKRIPYEPAGRLAA
jgi:hypothetical protein